MKKRIFIAINLPENIKEKLFGYREKWPELPARWTKRENLHITLFFLGNVFGEELPEICEAVQKTTAKNSSFYVKINKIGYGPLGQTPKMIWAIGKNSKELTDLRQDLNGQLGGLENKRFACHITLARIRFWEFKKIEIEDRPQIEESLDLDFRVKSIDIMESILKRGGSDYKILQSYKLKAF